MNRGSSHTLPIRKTTYTMKIQKRTLQSGRVRWIARWVEPNGKERSKTFDTKREATEYLTAVERAKHTGAYLNRERSEATVVELFDEWLATTPRRESSMVQYRNTRNNLITPIADYPARDVTPVIVNDWARQLATGRKWISKDDQGLAAASVRTALRHLRWVFNFAVENDVVRRNPVTVPGAADAIESDELPTKSEIMAVVDGVRAGGAKYILGKGDKARELREGPNPTIADMMEVAMYTGLRVSELAGLMVAEVDYAGGVLRVRKQLGKAWPRERVELKTERSRRDVPLCDQVIPILRAYTNGRGAGEYLFTNKSGGAMNTSHMAKIVAHTARALGMEHVHFHALRHFFISTILTTGVPVHEAARIAGHTPEMMLKTYAHVIRGMNDRLACAITNAFGVGEKSGRTALRVVGGSL